MFNVIRRADTCVIYVNHELDFQSAASFASAIALVAREFVGHLAISLEECTFCDASVLTVLIRAKQALGPRLTIVVPAKSRVSRIFEICGLMIPLDVRDEVQIAPALAS